MRCLAQSQERREAGSKHNDVYVFQLWDNTLHGAWAEETATIPHTKDSLGKFHVHGDAIILSAIGGRVRNCAAAPEVRGEPQLGLPFSDKKIIPRNMKQDGTDGSSVGIPSVSRKRKTSEFRSEPFLGKEQPFHSKPFSMIKPWKSFPNLFQKRKLWDSVLNHFRKKKNSEFHSEPFSEEKTLGNPFQTIFGNRKH